MLPEMAEAAEKLEPGAVAAAAAAFEASNWGARPAPAPAREVEMEQEMLAAAASAPVALAITAADGSKQDAGSEKDDVSQSAEASTAADQSGVQPELRVVRPSAALEALPRSAVRRALERAGLGAPQLLPALHMAVLAAVAGVLVVCRAAYVGLGERSTWVAITGAWGSAPRGWRCGQPCPGQLLRRVPWSAPLHVCNAAQPPPCPLPASSCGGV